jgi:dynein heavy chain, axonemal
VQDLFPSYVMPERVNTQLGSAVTAAATASQLQPTASLLNKAAELHATMVGRFGVMLVGPATSGKTAARRTLHTALCSTDNQNIACHVLNPKALTLEELFGSHSELTGDWKDGLASKLCRDAVAPESTAMSWIIFDGPVEATWVESLNTALDDSCTLCLPSGERMKLDAQRMRMLFEVEDLHAASPATVSRCGMVYVPVSSSSCSSAGGELVESDPIFESWLQRLPGLLAHTGARETATMAGSDAVSQQDNTNPAGWQSDLRRFHRKYVPSGEAWLATKASEAVPTTHQQRISSLCTWLEVLLQSSGLHLNGGYGPAAKTALEYMFAFAFVWGLGGALDATCREAWDKVVRGLFNGSANFPGGAGTVYDFCCNPERNFAFQVCCRQCRCVQVLEGAATLRMFICLLLHHVLVAVATSSIGTKAGIAVQAWRDLVPFIDTSTSSTAPFSSIFIPTAESACYSWFVRSALQSCKPVLISGSPGAGKTATIQKCLDWAVESQQMDAINVSLSAKTTAAGVQGTIEGDLGKKSPMSWGSTNGRRYAIFVDDVNMPECGQYGAQAPLELLRLLLVRFLLDCCNAGVLKTRLHALSLVLCASGVVCKQGHCPDKAPVADENESAGQWWPV